MKEEILQIRFSIRLVMMMAMTCCFALRCVVRSSFSLHHYVAYAVASVEIW
jgi:hypothetical protein